MTRPWMIEWMRAAGAALALSSAGCMEFDGGLGDAVRLGTHVTDWRDEVVYQLLVDRFADGDAGNNWRVDLSAPGKWHGGDWAGLEGKLDYLSELGVTTLWISPVVKNVDTDAGFDGYHGYWAQDLTEPNPHFGDITSLRTMVAAAHGRGMKVILDIVTNHVGQLYYYDINMNGEPDERVRGNGTSSPVVHINEYDPDFDPRGVQAYTSLGEAGPAPVVFVYDPASNHVPPMPEVLQNPAAYNRKGRAYDFEDPDQLIHGDFPGGLKDLNTTRCDVKRALVDAYARWIELTDADGFRIDTIKHVEPEFWRYFTQKVRQRLAKKGKKKFFMFGEAFDGDDALVGSFTRSDAPPDEIAREGACVEDGRSLTGDQFDSVFYFPQYFQAIRDVFQQAQSTDRIERLWADRMVNYGSTANQLGTGLRPTQALVNFLDNHDVPRFLFSGAGEAALKNALAFIFTEDGIPCIYYGTEQGFAGGNDPANREDLWETGYATDGGIFRWIRRLAALRRAYPALRRGDLRVAWSTSRVADESDAGIFAFERTGGDAADAYALVIFNTNREHPSSPGFGEAPMMVGAAPGTVLVDVLGDGSSTAVVAPDGSVTVQLPPQSAVVLVPTAQVESNL